MVSVTQRISKIKQPRGGYIKPKDFVVTDLLDNDILNEGENIHSSLVGLSVDYLTRFLNGAPIEEAFKIALMEAFNVKKVELANDLLFNIQGTDDISIESA
ncbi:hypothetical protein [Bacillus thuringiensis]|uniref:hypothetical protein n=1 Tax=Bacillus thuringiensis TaxID=1428 RepID=UPI001F0A4963|nr:hypothetical protein [Bacillus thuringiensis]